MSGLSLGFSVRRLLVRLIIIICYIYYYIKRQTDNEQLSPEANKHSFDERPAAQRLGGLSDITIIYYLYM